MRTRRRRSTAVSLISVFALLLAACGGEESQEVAAEDPDGLESADQEAPDEPSGDDELEEAREFFRGETMTFIVPYSAGGGFDTQVRVLAPYLGEALGANVVVDNRDGAGGLLGINQLVAEEPDGLTIALMNGTGSLAAAIGEQEGVQFEPAELSYLGALGVEPVVMTVGTQTPYESFEDVREAEDFRFASLGPGAADFLNAQVLTQLFDLNAEVIAGYEGGENLLAVTRGETDGVTTNVQSALPHVEEGDHRPIVMLSERNDDRMPDVPLIEDVDFPSDEARQLMGNHVDLLEAARPVIAPPGVDDARLQVLREAFVAAVNDPDYQAETEEAGRSLDYQEGQEIADRVAELMDAPDAYRNVVIASFEG